MHKLNQRMVGMILLYFSFCVLVPICHVTGYRTFSDQ